MFSILLQLPNKSAQSVVEQPRDLCYGFQFVQPRTACLPVITTFNSISQNRSRKQLENINFNYETELLLG